MWTTTYRSPIQKATAYSDVKASFDSMSVPVRVPADSWDDPYIYRVRVKMFWYRSDGSVQGTAKHGVHYYGGGAGAGWDYVLDTRNITAIDRRFAFVAAPHSLNSTTIADNRMKGDRDRHSSRGDVWRFDCWPID